MLTPRAHTHATQESDRELSELQLQLATGAEERGQLQAALAAAQDRQREAEGLSAELTAALQQHKAAVAALQQDKAELVRQLARCTPGEFDRLHAELMAAKRHASELVVVQEALERTRAHLSDAEGRLADQQVGAGCLCCSVLRQPCCCWHGGMLMSDHASPPLAHPYTPPPPPPPPHTHFCACRLLQRACRWRWPARMPAWRHSWTAPAASWPSYRGSTSSCRSSWATHRTLSRWVCLAGLRAPACVC
jgi:hypothetical protein